MRRHSTDRRAKHVGGRWRERFWRLAAEPRTSGRGEKTHGDNKNNDNHETTSKNKTRRLVRSETRCWFITDARNNSLSSVVHDDARESRVVEVAAFRAETCRRGADTLLFSRPPSR